MVTLKELTTYCDLLLTSSTVQDYCTNGLQVEGKKEINRIVTAVSADLATIQAAVNLGTDVMIVHHGIFWNGDNYAVVGTKREKLRLLLQNQISLLAYHLPLDMHQELGNNWKAARDMGWSDLKPFGFSKGLAIGVQGRISPTTREKFQEQLEKYYQHQAHTALGGKEKIETIGLISGGSYRNITDAASAGLDCFVTGNFDEPVWNQAFEEKVNFFALGHTATERIGPKALGEHLQQKFSLQYQFIDTKNPF